jgi:hypothetical protein
MDELVARELGKLTLTVIKQGATVEALRIELAKRDAELTTLKAADPELAIAAKGGTSGHAGVAH